MHHLVEAHHRLINKEKRLKIEESAREKEIGLIISPRTLTQGIDIGTVVRIVHLGLPLEVREFKQRGEQKRRRKEMPFSETIVFPKTRWDRKLLERNPQDLIDWVQLPLENVYMFGSIGILGTMV